MRAPFPEDHNHLFVHFHYIFVLIQPLQYLFNQGNLLHYFTSSCIAFGVIPLYFICKKRGLSKPMIICIIIYYFSNKYIHRNFMAFHYEPIVIPLLLSVFAFRAYGMFKWGFLAVIMAFGVRDDFALLIGAAFLSYIPFDHKVWKFWLISGIAGLGRLNTLFRATLEYEGTYV